MKDSYIDFSNCRDYAASDFREIIDSIEDLIISMLMVIPDKDNDVIALKDLGDVLYTLRDLKDLLWDKRDEEAKP